MGPAFNWHVTVRPIFVRAISPASDKTSRCFMTAGREIGNGRASSLTDRLFRSPSCASSARRVGSAKAAKVRSRSLSTYLTIELSISAPHHACQAAPNAPA